MRLVKILLFTLALLIPFTTAWAQSGKIAGQVVDAASGEELPGVNVSIVGTTQGAVTDAEGYYSIINVRPGSYDLRASFVGFTEEIRENVRVNIDLTTTENFRLREETVGLDEVVVAAMRPIVQRDVSASVANLASADLENLPSVDVEKVIGLQAGFERGLTIRGSSGSQVQFQVDGFTTQGGLTNVPFTGISFTAVDEIQVQTGGFNAEYGNVRTGLINVVTKEGPRDHYFADAIVRYSSPSQKYFPATTIDGQEVKLPNDELAYHVRPFFDEDVAMGGTGSWDQFMRDSYTTFEEGWVAIAQNFNDSHGANITPEQAQEAFRWYLRKDFELDDPDYEIDATIGGPVPGISPYLGDLRFTASFRNEQSAYIVPMIRDVYGEQTVQGKLTSDLAQGIRFELHGMWAKQKGINPDEGNNPWGLQSMWTGDMPYYPWDFAQPYLARAIGGEEIFATHFRNPMDVTRGVFGGKLTHTLGSKTFYEAQLQRVTTENFTHADDERDPTVQQRVGEIELTEEPFGWEWRDAYDVLGTGLRTGGHWFSARDSSKVSRWAARFDLTSQVNRFMEVKTGLEYILSDYDVNMGEVDPAHPHHTNPNFVWQRSPQQGAAYGQTKLEFRGIVANVGLRMDYFHGGGEWYDFDPFTRVLSAQFGRDALDDPEALEREDWGTQSIGRQLNLSPRLGVSFPITENSKLYFNYGHFREMPQPFDIFNVQEINTGAVSFIGNPELDMPKTVSYELGYEQNIADMFLLRLAGYYKDLTNQGRGVNFQSIDGEVNYSTIFPYNYSDVRGAEITLSKNRGAWLRGFVNYTYMAWKGGNFGVASVFENPVRMREYLLSSTDFYPSTPIPEPYGRANLEVLFPKEIGPEIAGGHPLGDWRVTFLGEWRAGQTLTWNGQTLTGGRSSSRELQGNIKTRDFYTLDMRFSKAFNTAIGQAQFFVDLTNVLNIRHMYGFGGGDDRQRYLRSLHLPDETFEGLRDGKPTNYTLIPGDDKVGHFRDHGAPFVPIIPRGDGTLPETGVELSYDISEYSPHNSPLYYLPADCGEGTAFCGGTYFQWTGSDFVEASSSVVEKVKDDKAYIDMPNTMFNTFLNPRNVFFGLRLRF